jgi:hypothetical protein
VVTAQWQQQLQQQQRISSPVHLRTPSLNTWVWQTQASTTAWLLIDVQVTSSSQGSCTGVAGGYFCFFCWRLLHAGVKVGARLMVAAGRQALDPAQCVT